MSVKGFCAKWLSTKSPYYQFNICEEGDIIKRLLISPNEGEIVSIKGFGKFHIPKHNDGKYENKRWFLRRGRCRIINFDVLSSEPMKYVYGKDVLDVYEPVVFRKETTTPEILEVLMDEKTTDDINSSSNKHEELARLIVYTGCILAFICVMWFIFQ